MAGPDTCPCGTGAPYEACCGAIHAGRRPAATAEKLMRARYSAFALGLAGFLGETWHPSTRPASLDLDGGLVWTGLVIEHTTEGSPWDDAGTVRFAASWTSGRRTGVLRETSRFAFFEGRWVYVDGSIHH